MRSGRDGFIERYGGRRPAETDEQFAARKAQIDEIHARKAAGKITIEDVEKLSRLRGDPPAEWDYEDRNE